MVFKITGHCTQNCIHCMQDSTKDGVHATQDIIDKMIMFGKLSPRTTTISISGGEPMDHPEFLQILDKVLDAWGDTLPITIITNGEMFVGLKDNPAKKALKKEVIRRLHKHPYLLMQVTTVEGIYPGHKGRLKAINKGCAKLRKKGIFDKLGIVVCTDMPHGIIPIGRAKDNIKKLEEVSFIAQRKSPSCFNMYNSLSSHNGSFFEAIDFVKMNSMASFCKPMITETGQVKFGEYSICSTVIDLAEISMENMESMMNMSVDVSQVLGPCSKCVNNAGMQSVIDQYLYKFKKPDDILPAPKEVQQIPTIPTLDGIELKGPMKNTHENLTNIFKKLREKDDAK